jgi:hypothetical protein
MSTSAVEPWIIDLFRAVDALDASTFAKAFTDDAYFRFGNAEPVIGRDRVEANLATFCTMIGGLSHEILGVWTGHRERGEVRAVESAVTYTCTAGRRTEAIPVTTTIRLGGDRIADYRIFGDVSPLFAE